MADLIGAFHFLRPLWVLALIPLALIWWRTRLGKTVDHDVQRGIAPHLARALTVGFEGARRWRPIDGFLLILALWVLAAAGPTWNRVSNPLLAQTAPLAVLLKVTPSMENTDIQPSRHKRASFKILDLIDRRAGAQTALFAYAGSAHRVTPLTNDPNIVRSYLSGLTPDTMPIEGDRADLALELAETELARSETPGALLFVLDDLNPANVNRLNENAESRPPVIFFVVAGQGVQIPQIEQVENATIVNISPDDSDLDRIERRVLSAYREALLEDTNQEWEDRGYILAWPAAVLLLFWFRRGWTLLSVVALMLTVPFGRPAQADGWRDWFLTPDQQGQIAIRNKDYSEAADLFDNSEWRAFALLRAGRYEEAAQAYGFIETAAAANAQGIALLRNRKYRDGVRAFEKALERDPTDAAARANLEVARAIVAFVETTQAASDTGEEGIGADDTVYDNESGLGEEMLVERPEEDGLPAGLSTEDWMRSIDTQVGDFLASRFRLEVARDAQ